MTRKGRKRTTTRTRSGRAVSQRQSITTPEIEAMRRGILGDTDKHSQDWRTDQRLGTAIGRMHCRGLVTDRQYAAGAAVWATWRSWAVQADSPPRHARAAVLPVAATEGLPQAHLVPSGGETDEERWLRLKEIVDDLEVAVRGVLHHQLAWSLLQSVCADDVMPRTLEQSGPLADKCWAALRDALDAAAGVFKIPNSEKEAA